jgi:hypothetical protein
VLSLYGVGLLWLYRFLGDDPVEPRQGDVGFIFMVIVTSAKGFMTLLSCSGQMIYGNRRLKIVFFPCYLILHWVVSHSVLVSGLSFQLGVILLFRRNRGLSSSYLGLQTTFFPVYQAAQFQEIFTGMSLGLGAVGALKYSYCY